MAPKRKKSVAVVNCSGTSSRLREPEAGMDCQAALEAYPQGIMACEWGCLGLGSCVAACRLGAVYIGESGAAQIDREKCVGCGLCVKACPKGLVRLVEPSYTVNVRCASKDVGPDTRKVCETGCIACGICERNCPAAAIFIVDNHAVIDESRCIVCGMCAVKCPRGTIVDADGVFTVAR